MKTLIIGGHGQLGRELFREFQTRHFDILSPSHHQMNITDIKAVKNYIDLHQPSFVINAAAYTQVDKAESEASLAFAVNNIGCKNLAQICAKNGIPLLQVSTDYVFDGQKFMPYHESDPISPMGVYGRSKAAGEIEIKSNLTEHIILRTSWLYGVHGQNFVKTMLKLAGTKEIIRVVSDQYGSPTCAGDLATAILVMIDKWQQQSAVAWGTYHYCGQGIVSWHEFAEATIEQARRYGEVKTKRVEPITTADYPTKARRPAFSALDCNLIKKNFGISPKPWRKSLNSTIQRLCERSTTVDGPPLENSPR